MFDKRHVCATTGWSGSTQVLSLYAEERLRSVTPTLSDGPPTTYTWWAGPLYKGVGPKENQPNGVLWCTGKQQLKHRIEGIIPNLTRFKDAICFSQPLYTLIILTLTFVMFKSYYLSKEKSLSTGAPSSGLVLLRRYENPPNIWEKIGSWVQLTLTTYRSCLYSCEYVCHSIG